MNPSRDIGRLLEIMVVLRTPETGCPWDLAQNFSTIAPYTLEEAYEVADAIARDDLADLKDELGDLCFRSSSMRGWQKNRAPSILAPWCKRSPRSSFVGILTFLPMKLRELRARSKAYGSVSKRRKRQLTKLTRPAPSPGSQSDSLLYPAPLNCR